MHTSRFFSVTLVAAAAALACTTLSCTETASAPQAPVAAKAPPAPAVAKVAGTWSWSVDAGGQAITHTVVLTQDGEKLTGKFTDSFDNSTVDLKEGKIHDGQVTLTVERPFMDNGNLSLKFVGKLEGDTIKGTMEINIGDQPTTSDWLAKRGT